MKSEPSIDGDYDVVISGYGPTGLTAASLLSARGHRVCAFDRWPTLYGQPRMATIDGESARIIQAACDADQAFRNSLPRRKYIFANSEGEVLVDMPWDRDHVCGFPLRISLHQPDVEDAIDFAARRQGVEISQGWEVHSIEQSVNEVLVTARERIVDSAGDTTWGHSRTVRAKYLIAADGARSTARERLGVERESWPFRNGWLSFDAVRKRTLPNIFGVSPDAQVAAIFCAPAGRAHSIIPLGKHHIRFNLEADPDGDHRDKLNREFAYRFLRDVYGVGEDDVEVYRHAIYAFEGKLAMRWRVGRVFLAGDAAHVMTPFLGQGGCSALRDAINLSWKLDLVLRGLASEEVLDSYETERKPHCRVYIDGSDRLAALAFVRDAAEARARDARYRNGDVSSVVAEPFLTDGILDSKSGASAPVGQLGPQGIVEHGGLRGRFDDLFGWGFQLLGCGFNPAERLDESRLAFLRAIGCTVAGIGEHPDDGLVLDKDGAYGRYFDAHGVQVMLVRPDFAVFGAARTAEGTTAIVDELQTQLGRPN